MSVNGTGVLDNSVSGAYLGGWSSGFSYNYFSGILGLATTYVDTLEIGKRCKEFHIVNPTANPIQFRFREHFGSSRDGGVVLNGQTVILRNMNREALQLRCDAGAVSGAFVMAF